MDFKIDLKLIEDVVIQIQSRSMSDPPLSDIDFKNKMAWVWSPDSGLSLKNVISFDIFTESAAGFVQIIETGHIFEEIFVKFHLSSLFTRDD